MELHKVFLALLFEISGMDNGIALKQCDRGRVGTKSFLQRFDPIQVLSSSYALESLSLKGASKKGIFYAKHNIATHQVQIAIMDGKGASPRKISFYLQISS